MNEPFDLQRALAGEKVVNDAGVVLHITKLPLPLKDGRNVLAQRETGQFFAFVHENGMNEGSAYYTLFMAPLLREGWINIYPSRIKLHPSITRKHYAAGPTVFLTEENAKFALSQAPVPGQSVKITFEE